MLFQLLLSSRSLGNISRAVTIIRVNLCLPLCKSVVDRRAATRIRVNLCLPLRKSVVKSNEAPYSRSANSVNPRFRA